MTQADRLFTLLLDKQKHSNIEINEKLSIWRVAARILDLRARGHEIEAENGTGSLYWYRLKRTAQEIIGQELEALERFNETHQLKLI